MASTALLMSEPPSVAAERALIGLLRIVGVLHHAAVLAALKNKPCGRPLKEQPFLTAAARAGSPQAWAGTEAWQRSTEQKDAPLGSLLCSGPGFRLEAD
jgi:hypothetical protein